MSGLCLIEFFFYLLINQRAADVIKMSAALNDALAISYLSTVVVPFN